MHRFNSIFVIILVTFTIILSGEIFAQGNNKIAPPTVIKYSGSSSTNDVSTCQILSPRKLK